MTVEYCMARGFESKDVEYQQAERERLRVARGGASPEGSAANRRGLVQMSLVRMRSDLQTARVTAHRTMLEGAIATLEAELASIP